MLIVPREALDDDTPNLAGWGDLLDKVRKIFRGTDVKVFDVPVTGPLPPTFPPPAQPGPAVLLAPTPPAADWRKFAVPVGVGLGLLWLSRR